jgi:ABC-type amino acid transport system permease subunit
MERYAEIFRALLVLAGLVCLAFSVLIPASPTADNLTVAAVALAGLGVVAYLVEAWRAGAMGVSMGEDEDVRASTRGPDDPGLRRS